MLPGMRSQVLKRTQERTFKMQAAEEQPSEEAAQQTARSRGWEVGGAGFPITAGRGDLRVRRGRG